MDATELRQIFERLDAALEHPTELLVRGGAAVLAHGSQQRVTIDIDVLPASRFVEADLRRACVEAGVGFNPSDKDFTEAFSRLPARLKDDPVVRDNLRYVVEDYL